MSQLYEHTDFIEFTKNEFKEAVQFALHNFAETKRILELPYMTTEEVAKVYPIGKSTLDKLRAKREGPEFIQATKNSPAMYTHEDIKKWLNRRRQKVF